MTVDDCVKDGNDEYALSRSYKSSGNGSLGVSDGTVRKAYVQFDFQLDIN